MMKSIMDFESVAADHKVYEFINFMLVYIGHKLYSHKLYFCLLLQTQNNSTAIHLSA